MSSTETHTSAIIFKNTIILQENMWHIDVGMEIQFLLMIPVPYIKYYFSTF